jgi:hypothetical protein
LIGIDEYGTIEKCQRPDNESKEAAESLKNQMIPLKDSRFIEDSPWLNK